MRTIIVAAIAALICATGTAGHAEARGWAWFVKNTRSGPHCAGRPTTYYGEGRRNADGSAFNPEGYSAATWDYPFGTVLAVTNCRNGRTVHVTVKDRGPGRLQRALGIRLDLSRGAARVIALGQNGRFESGWTSWSVVSLGSGGTVVTSAKRGRHHRRELAPTEPMRVEADATFSR